MSEERERPELIIALVCPLGAPIEKLERAIRKELSAFAYDCESISVSDLLRNLDFWTPEPDGTERTRIEHRQNKALEFRRRGGPDALARAAIAAIRDRRRLRGRKDPDRPASGCAYILRQLKHPKEVQLLRRVYGQSVVVIAGHAPEELRVRELADAMARRDGRAAAEGYEHDATRLIHIDEKEDRPNEDEATLGQNTRDTYPLADFFVNLARSEDEPVQRFIQLLFGHPFGTPTPDEMAMHQAYATALRSSDERRQVGAVIVSRSKQGDSKVVDADIIAAGMNEVPRRGGGFYWEGGDFLDARDQGLRRSTPVDREDRIKADALREIAARLKGADWLAPKYAALNEAELSSELLTLLRRTQFMDISEFMRQVHAEMAALVDAAKRGVAVRNAEMYVTTYPCHGCAKHIIAAGIGRVIYLEPYPKSRAEMLHREEIVMDPIDPSGVGDRVLFVPFTGVAPRQYARLFTMADRGRRNGLGLDEWNERRRELSPRYVLADAGAGYVHTERTELGQLPKEYRWDRAALCPAPKARRSRADSGAK